VNGRRSIFGAEGTILEAFKPGDEPPATPRTIGQTASNGTRGGKGAGVVLVPARKPASQPAQDGGLTSGGGGLY
jgi:penicillin-binding protein 1A